MSMLRVQQLSRNGCVLASLVIILLVAATIGRNRLYSDSGILWEDSVSKAPGKARPHYNLSLVYRDRGRMDLAQAEWERIIAIDPAFSQAYNHLGILAYLGRDYEKALQYYLRAVGTGPTNAEAHYNLALTYEALGRHEQAIAHYERFLSLATDDQQQVVNEVRNRLAALRK